MPTSNELVRNKPVVILRDTVCSGVIVKKDLIKEKQLTGKFGYVVTIAGTLLNAPFANIEASKPYLKGAVKVCV